MLMDGQSDRIRAFTALIIVVLISLGAAKRYFNSQTPTNPHSKDGLNYNTTTTGPRTVAIITPAASGEFNSDLINGARDEAKLLGWNNIQYYAPTGDADDAELKALAFTAISKKPDAISVCGLDPTSLEAVIAKANQAEIPIFVHNQLNGVRGDVQAYIGYDEYAAAQALGEYLLTLIAPSHTSTNGSNKKEPPDLVAILDGSPGEHTNRRALGFREALKYSVDVRIVEEKSAHWSKQEADTIVSKWLQRYPDLKTIYACSDLMASGAAHAVWAQKRTVRCLGFGGSRDALFSVKGGDLTATVAVEPAKIGKRIIDTMMDFFGNTGTLQNGQAVKTAFTVVNNSNVSEFLGGFAADKIESRPDSR